MRSLDAFITSASDIESHDKYRFSLPSLNYAIGDMDGFEGGRVLTLYGPYSSGKSSLALDLIANTQIAGHTCAYVDFERSYRIDHATRYGVNSDDLLLIKTDTSEQGLEAALYVIRERGVKLLVIDSIGAAEPESEVDKTLMDPEKVSSQASFQTRWSRRVPAILDNYGAAIVLIAQIRSRFKGMKETKPGIPNALLHLSSVMVETRRIKNVAGKKTLVRATVTKNKLAPEGMLADFWIDFAGGIDVNASVFSSAVDLGIVTQKGAHYTYNNEKAHGAEKAIHTFPMDDIKKKVEDRLNERIAKRDYNNG